MKSIEKLLLIFLVCYHPEIRTYACLFTFYSLLHTQCNVTYFIIFVRKLIYPIICFFFGCSKLVRQRPMKSLSSVCPSVLSFLKIGSLDFPDIVHDDS